MIRILPVCSTTKSRSLSPEGVVKNRGFSKPSATKSTVRGIVKPEDVHPENNTNRMIKLATNPMVTDKMCPLNILFPYANCYNREILWRQASLQIE
jgi:hypothetical protein